jgi:hypothetical protein
MVRRRGRKAVATRSCSTAAACLEKAVWESVCIRAADCGGCGRHSKTAHSSTADSHPARTLGGRAPCSRARASSELVVSNTRTCSLYSCTVLSHTQTRTRAAIAATASAVVVALVQVVASTTGVVVQVLVGGGRGRVCDSGGEALLLQ